MECSGRQGESDIIQRPRSSPDLEGDSPEDEAIMSKTRKSPIRRRSASWKVLHDMIPYASRPTSVPQADLDNHLASVPVPVHLPDPAALGSVLQCDAVTQHRLVPQKYPESIPRDVSALSGVTRYDRGGEGRGTCHSQAPRPTRRRPRPSIVPCRQRWLSVTLLEDLSLREPYLTTRSSQAQVHSPTSRLSPSSRISYE